MAVKINKELAFFAVFDPTKDSKSVSIGTLCKDIEDGKMTLPIFQTYIRWTLEKSVSLLNFQLNGMAPVSPISINIIEDIEIATDQVTFVEREFIEKTDVISKYSCIDGQQRLSCNYKAYTDHDDFRCVVLDIRQGKFIINTGAIKEDQIPVGKLYNRDDKEFDNYLKQHKGLQVFEVQNILTKVRNKFLGYYYIVNYAKDLTEEQQLDWFEVLNLAGSRVTEVQVHLTDMLVKGVDFYKEFSNKFYDTLYESSLHNLFNRKTTEVSIPLATLNAAYEKVHNKEHKLNFSPIPSDAKGMLMGREEDVNKIREMFRITLISLERAINFILENNFINKVDRIDYVTYLTGAYVYIGDTYVNESQQSFLIEWVNKVNFASKGNSQRRQIFSDLIKVSELR